MKCRIGELCDAIGSGGTPSRKNDTFYKGNVKWLKTKELNDGCIYDTEEHITNEAIKKSSAKLFPRNTITVAMYGATVGKLGILKDEMATNQACCNMVVNKNKCDYRFLYYSLLVNRNELINLANGAAQQNLNKGIIENFEIDYYPIEIQEGIANILYSLDSKIELNNKMNKTLEEMAQALFKRWFVDFEFPNQDGKPYKSSGGEMVDSEMGMIPKGLKVKKINDVSINYDSKRKPLSSRERDKLKKIYPYYGASSLVDYVEDYLFDGTYVLMAEDGSNVVDEFGYPDLQYVWGKFWVNNHAHVLTGKGKISTEYIYLFLKSTNLSYLVTGAAQPKINQKNLNSVDVIVANNEVLDKFNKVIDILFMKKKNLTGNTEYLIKLRNLLLPKLMSGEIRVNDIEANL